MSAAVSGVLRLRRYASWRRRRAAAARRLQGPGAHRRRARRRAAPRAAASVDCRRRAARAVPRARRARCRKLTGMGIHTQVVTSAVRPIPESWATIAAAAGLRVDRRPAARARRAARAGDLRSHSQAHQGAARDRALHDHARSRRGPGYVTEFTEFWATLPDVKRIWFSLYTPQKGEESPERLPPEDRQRVVAEIRRSYAREPKLNDMRPARARRATCGRRRIPTSASSRRRRRACRRT